MSALTPIPVPARQRWREFRIQAIPALVFAGTVLLTVILWRDQTPTTMLVGEVESVTATVASPKSGMLADLHISPLQQVSAGDPIAQVITTDPKVIQSSLAVILAEIQLLRVNMEPLMGGQRHAMSYERLRLDWMEQRVQLASARTRLQLAENEYRRISELYRDKVVSDRALEEAQSTRERLVSEVEERSRLVDEHAKSLTTLGPMELLAGATNSPSADSIMEASIKVQEERLRLTEAELSPIVLRVPINGVISALLHRSGEAVVAGEPILTISAGAADKIVAYAAQPVSVQPKVGMTVEVRTRSFHRRVAQGKVLKVGSQFVPIKSHLLPFSNASVPVMGLQLIVSLPPALGVLPGETVDLRILPDKE